MKQSKAIEVAAYLAVADCVKYKIPIVVIPPPYRKDPPGISDHAYVTKRLKDGNHTDVGASFPWDYFAECVSKFMPKAQPKKEPEKPPVTPANPTKPPAFTYPSERDMAVQVWEQLFGPKGRGWPQLGGRTLVDAVAELLKQEKK